MKLYDLLKEGKKAILPDGEWVLEFEVKGNGETIWETNINTGEYNTMSSINEYGIDEIFGNDWVEYKGELDELERKY